MAVTLFSIVLYAVGISLGMLKSSLKFANQRKLQIMSKVVSASHLEKIAIDLDSHRLNILPRIHPNGVITYSTGALNIVHESRHPPREGSDAITTASISTKSALRVTKEAGSGLSREYIACTVFPTLFVNKDLNGEREFIAVTADGLVEMIGKKISIVENSEKQKCYSLNLKAISGMLLEISNDFSKEHPLLLFPITSLYSLYVDSKDTLRFIGHRGDLNIENQPLVSPIRSMKLSMIKLAKFNTAKFVVEISLPDGFTEELSFQNSLSRISTIEHLFTY
ncbi:MAG: hypothetical protein KDD53_01525 [Bdellovibrionales bacterium]|nr:hypothetical protein [Bdellovibrionales bacterium]